MTLDLEPPLSVKLEFWGVSLGSLDLVGNAHTVLNAAVLNVNLHALEPGERPHQPSGGAVGVGDPKGWDQGMARGPVCWLNPQNLQLLPAAGQPPGLKTSNKDIVHLSKL